MAATLTLLHFVMYLPFTACFVQRTVSLARRLLSAGENEYSTGYILCQQKFYFFSKIFHFFFDFFSGEENRGIRAGILPDDRGKAPEGDAPGWTGPPHGLWRPAAQPWSGGGLAASRERSGRPRVTELNEHDNESARTEGRQPDYLAQKYYV